MPVTSASATTASSSSASNPPSAPRFAVLLVNLGTPDAPTPKAVRRYLAEFLWDKRVVDTPRPLWWLILHGIILRLRPKPVAKNYQKIWTPAGSPLLAIARQQQEALHQALAQEYGQQLPVFLGMTYGTPSLAAALASCQHQAIEKLLVLPLYPQYSATTSAAVFDAIAKALRNQPNLPELRFIKDYATHPAYIQALAASVRQAEAEQGAPFSQLVMSFHSIPQRYVDQGDPYAQRCEATATALAQELGLNADQWRLTYQSVFGREPWLQPATDASMQELGAAQTASVGVICPGFSADCLETLEEIALENKAYFQQAGGGKFTYIPALNARKEQIKLLQQLVQQHSQGW